MVILPYDFRIGMTIERDISGVVTNRLMVGRVMSYEECMEKSMSPIQKDVAPSGISGTAPLEPITLLTP